MPTFNLISSVSITAVLRASSSVHLSGITLSFMHPVKQVDCGGTAPYRPGAAQLRQAIAVQ